MTTKKAHIAISLLTLFCLAPLYAAENGVDNYTYFELFGLSDGFSINYERTLFDRFSLRLGHGGGIHLGSDRALAYPMNQQTFFTAKYVLLGDGESIRLEAEMGLIAYKKTLYGIGPGQYSETSVIQYSKTSVIPGGGIGLRFGKGSGFLWGLECEPTWKN